MILPNPDYDGDDRSLAVALRHLIAGSGDLRIAVNAIPVTEPSTPPHCDQPS